MDDISTLEALDSCRCRQGDVRCEEGVGDTFWCIEIDVMDLA